MKHWVYIYEEKKDNLKTALSDDVGKIVSSQILKGPIIYLSPFETPFEALAHKHLLENLSKETVLRWIKKHKEKTELWKHATNE